MALKPIAEELQKLDPGMDNDEAIEAAQRLVDFVELLIEIDRELKQKEST